MPELIGSTTVRVNAAAIAASIALPPAANISNPAVDARAWLVETTPLDPKTGLFKH